MTRTLALLSTMAGLTLAADGDWPGLVLPYWPTGASGPTQPLEIPPYPPHSDFVNDQLNYAYVQTLHTGEEFKFTNGKAGANQSFFTGAVGLEKDNVHAAEYGAWPIVNWNALKGLDFSTGVFWFGECGTVSFHNHPNCIEIDTVIRGTGVFGHLRPDGLGIDYSPPLTPGQSYIMPKGSLHFYINLSDEEPLWFDAIFSGCANIGIQSVPGFLGQVPAGVNKGPTAETNFKGPTPDVLGAFTEILKSQSEGIHNHSPLNPFGFIPRCNTIVHDVIARSNLSSVERTGPYGPTFKTAFTDKVIDDRPINNASFGEGGFVNWVVGDYNGPSPDIPMVPEATWPSLNGIPASFAYWYLEANGGFLAPSVVDADGIYTVLSGTAVVFQFTYSLELIWDVITTNQMYLVASSVLHFFVSVDPTVPLKMWAKYNSQHPVSFKAQAFIAQSFSTVLQGMLTIPKPLADALLAPGQLSRFIMFNDAAALKTWAINNPKWTGYPYSNQGVPGTPALSVREITHRLNQYSKYEGPAGPVLPFVSFVLSIIGILLFLCLACYVKCALKGRMTNDASPNLQLVNGGSHKTLNDNL